MQRVQKWDIVFIIIMISGQVMGQKKVVNVGGLLLRIKLPNIL